MKTIYRIAKTELATLFYSPIAWLILVIFTFQASMSFSEMFDIQVKYQSLGYSLYSVTNSIFGGMGGIFATMQENLYLYIPLLTMGLMSREMSSGSIKLLYSSPVTNTQIILGKYLSTLIYGLILIGILFIYVVFGICTVKNMDLPLVLSGLLGLYLLICAYAAIGLFMSTLTSYQVVAALGTLALLAVLNFIRDVGQSIALVRDITYWLSISGRASELIDGLLCSEDILYFLIVIILFVVLSILKLRSERQKQAWGIITGRYVLVIGIALFLGYLSSRPKLMFYHDATATQMRTLTPNSQKVMEQMKGGLKITTYVNLLEDNFWKGSPDYVNYDFEQFKKYVRFKPEIELEYVYYYDHAQSRSLDQRYPKLNDQERARETMRVLDLDSTLFLTPDEIRKVIDLRPEQNRFVRVIERSNGRKTFLRVFNDNQSDPSETEITAAFKRLVTDVPQVGFLTGHEERSIQREGDRDYSIFATNITFRDALVNQGYDVRTVTAGQAIPEDITILVIADMKTPLTAEEFRHIEAYIDRGGNLFLLGEPGRQEIINPLTAKLGVEFMPGCLVQTGGDFRPDLIVGNITKEAADQAGGYAYLASRGYKMTFPGATGLKYDGKNEFKAISLVVSRDSNSWNELETTDFENEKPAINPQLGEIVQSYPLVLALNRQLGEKEQRIIVVGDADCISNGEIGMNRKGIPASNYSLIIETFRSLCYDKFPIDTSRPLPVDDAVRPGLGALLWIKIVFMGILPIALAVWGIMLWVRRRRR